MFSKLKQIYFVFNFLQRHVLCNIDSILHLKNSLLFVTMTINSNYKTIDIYKLAGNMDDIDELQIKRRQLGEEDLEIMMDHDEAHEERQLKNKIIFSMQGLGGIRTIKRQDKILEAYIKGPHCEESVKDLVKFIRHDVPANPKARMILAQYNIIESDLLQLLILQVQDKKLSFWLIALMALLTNRPSDELNPDQREKIMISLSEYKNSFIKHQSFQILMVHIADYYKTPEEQRKKAHIQMLQFIILLIRNLVQISNSQKYPDLHNHFLAAFLKQDMFNPLLYIVQTDRSALMNKIDIPLLQIFYHTLTCFDPQSLFSINKVNLTLMNLSFKSSQKPLPSRHSRFMPTFRIANESGVKRVVHKLQQVQQKPHENQKKMPQRMVDYKKVIKLETEKLSDNFMKMQIQSQNNTTTIGDVIMELTRQFLQVQLQQLIKLVFDQIFRETAKVSDTNVVQYLLLCSWCLQMVRAKYYKERSLATDEMEKGRVQFNLMWIVQIMQNAHFELIYKILITESTREKKKDFKINLYNAGIKILNSYLDVVNDISNSFNMSDRKNANVLMANMFRHDIARILRVGFNQITHQGILNTLVRVTHKFFKLLSIYSDGKVLTIQTNKLLKRKKKRGKQMDSEDDQRGLINLNLQDSDEQVQQKKAKQNQIDKFQFQQRKYNQKSEFAIIAQYSVISKYMIFLRNQAFLNNDDELNDAIFYYIQQIKKLLNGEWLFFQAETICIFQKILASSEWTRKNKQKTKLIQGICVSFIRLLKKNSLTLVQSLFRYPNLSQKDQILKNYSDQYEQTGQVEQNMFTDE